MAEKRKRAGYDAEAARIDTHYSSRQQQSVQERNKSPIVHLRNVNNWVKSVLIRNHCDPGARVLDLACGKGGDLQKWALAQVGFYAGVDVAQESVQRDARERYNTFLRQGRVTFPAKFAVGNAFSGELHAALREYAPFDVASCQFALHYAFAEEGVARSALQNISKCLRPGGFFVGTTTDANVIVRKLRASDGLEFGNGVYKVVFDEKHKDKRFPKDKPYGLEYSFTLSDAVTDCAEWLVPRHVVQNLAREAGLELLVWRNFQDFIHDRLREVPEDAQLWREMVLGSRNAPPGMPPPTKAPLSDDEWDAARLYIAFIFRKRPDGEDAAPEQPDPPPARPIDPNDILQVHAPLSVAEGLDEEDDADG